MVYSTCSLNPIENEAVVAALISAESADFQLTVVNSDLHSFLKGRRGLTNWSVAWAAKNKLKKDSSNETETHNPNPNPAPIESLQWYRNFQDVPESLQYHRIFESM